MSEQESRLIRCFAAVFTALTPEEIRAADMQSLAECDSLAAVTLAAVVQEEFGVEIDPLELASLDSFEAFRQYVLRLSSAAE